MFSAVYANDHLFDHHFLKLDLPDGWQLADIPDGSAQETIGYLISTQMAGTSITIDCYRGSKLEHSPKSTRARALSTIAAVYPAGQEQLTKPEMLKSLGGSGTVETWRGFTNVGTQKLALYSPIASIKTWHCWLVMIGFAPEHSAEMLQRDFTAIARSAR